MTQPTPRRPKVILHVGTHKTGTTGIQFVLSENRAHLASVGVWYPRIDEFFPVDSRLPSARQHVAFAAAVANFTPLDRIKIARFVGTIHAHAAEYDRVIISAESMYRHLAPPLFDPHEESATQQRARYIDRLAAVFSRFDVEVLMYLRSVDRFATSFYAESIMASSNAQTFTKFLNNRVHRFDYRAQIDLFGAYFPLKLRSFEAAAKAGLIERFCEDAGIPGEMPETADRTRPSASNAAVLWLRRAKKEAGTMENIERKRRWHFSLLPINAALFETKNRTDFWTSAAERDDFIETYQSNVSEVTFPPVTSGIAPLARWSDAQHADAERQFHAWHDANEERLKTREANRIPPFALDV